MRNCPHNWGGVISCSKGDIEAPESTIVELSLKGKDQIEIFDKKIELLQQKFDKVKTIISNQDLDAEPFELAKFKWVVSSELLSIAFEIQINIYKVTDKVNLIGLREHERLLSELNSLLDQVAKLGKEIVELGKD